MGLWCAGEEKMESLANVGDRGYNIKGDKIERKLFRETNWAIERRISVEKKMA